MPAAHTLLLFVAAVLGLLVSPGPNMAFVLSQSLARGTRGAVAVAGGIFVADAIMTGLTVLGVVGIVSAWPMSLSVLRYAGAAWLAWLALRVWREPRTAATTAPSDARPLRAVFLRAVLVSLLNPKALLFFAAFLPQFVDPSRGRVAEQLLCLGALLSVLAFVFHVLLGLSSTRLLRLRDTDASRWLPALQSGVFLALAIRLFAQDTAGTR